MMDDLQSTELTPIVAQALGKESLKILDWGVTPLGAAGSKALGISEGVSRVSGTAQDHDGVHRWSLILKGLRESDYPGACDPASWSYWKREALAFESGLVAHLPGALSAPRCYAVQEKPHHRVWLWIEDIQESTSTWSMADYNRAACHLGQLNGAYLCGYPLPKAEPWMTWGRTRPWTATVQSWLAEFDQYAQTPAAQRVYRGDALARVRRQWAHPESMLQAFERLPVCFCHHDAFRRNLLARRTDGGGEQTVAIDWALTGFGRVGEEAGVTTAYPAGSPEAPAGRVRELDAAVFAGYVEGLGASGWRGEPRQARLGYAVNALVMATFGSFYRVRSAATPEGARQMEEAWKRPLDDIIENGAQALSFFLDLGDEAYQLAAAM